MTKTRELHGEALRHLAAAREVMRQLMAVSDDWTAKVQLEAEFQDVEQGCLDFATCQLGLDSDILLENLL